MGFSLVRIKPFPGIMQGRHQASSKACIVTKKTRPFLQIRMSCHRMERTKAHSYIRRPHIGTHVCISQQFKLKESKRHCYDQIRCPCCVVLELGANLDARSLVSSALWPCLFCQTELSRKVACFLSSI